MRLTKTAYDGSILQAAASHEPSFCLLYWLGQVSVWDVAEKKMFYRDSRTTFTWQAQRDRKRESEESEDDDEFFRAKPAIATKTLPVDLEEARDYHKDLDEMTSQSAALLAKWSTSPPEAWPTELNAETIVFLACYVAKLRSRHKISMAGWNTFKSSVEHRMKAIRPDDSTPPKSDGFSLVSYTSGYFGYLKRFEMLALPADQDNRELVEALAEDADIGEGHLAEFTKHFSQLVARANGQVLFKIWLAFEK